MSDLDDIEAKLLKIKLVREMEHALEILDRGPKHGALVREIFAEDPAESERSVKFLFDAIESKAIYDAAAAALRVRYETVKAELGM